MTLEAPRLDDRSFNDLVEEAVRRIPLYCPEWTDHNLSDPGITLIELFAWMTDIVLYRLNRVPDKHFIKFMELIGMQLREPEAAHVPITFRLSQPQPDTKFIRAGTAVATTRSENEPAIVFTTDEDANIYVPTLKYLLTSQKPSNQERRYNRPIDLQKFDSRFDDFAIFESDPPTSDDALYFGFEEDLSHHTLGLDFEVVELEAAGVDENHPPYEWEASTSGTDWLRAYVSPEEDATGAFNRSGLALVHLPAMQQSTIYTGQERKPIKAYWLRCRLVEEEGRPIPTKTPRFKSIVASSWGITVNARNVYAVWEEIVGRSDGSPGQRFYLEHTPIAPRQPGEYLVIRYSDGTEDRWTEVSDFADSGPNDKHYTIDSMNGEIRLAPALPQPDGSIRSYGMVPPKNALVVMHAYHYGGGQAGNVTKGALNILKTAIPYIDSVENLEAAQGGLDAENLEDLKLRVPGHLRSLGRAVTAADYEYLAHQAAPGRVGRVHCVQSSNNNPGEVRLLVIPEVLNYQGYIAPESLQLLPDLQEQITSYLDERRLITTRLVVSQPEYQWVYSEVRLRPAPKYDKEDLRLRVAAALFEYLNPLRGGDRGQGWPFGRRLLVTDILAFLMTVPGIDFVRSVTLRPAKLSKDEFQYGPETQEITISPEMVIASAEHTVELE